ncbi:MAG: AtpZ/AtpI family protein [Caulobacterales bacterium]
MSDAQKPGNDPVTPEDERRLASLRKEVSAAIEKRDERENLSNKASAAGDQKGMGVALRMASEFAAAIVVGAFLGYGADVTFHTSPWGLLICLPLGFAAGVLNVVRAAQKMSAGAPVGQDLPPERDDD